VRAHLEYVVRAPERKAIRDCGIGAPSTNSGLACGCALAPAVWPASCILASQRRARTRLTMRFALGTELTRVPMFRLAHAHLATCSARYQARAMRVNRPRFPGADRIARQGRPRAQRAGLSPVRSSGWLALWLYLPPDCAVRQRADSGARHSLNHALHAPRPRPSRTTRPIATVSPPRGVSHCLSSYGHVAQAGACASALAVPAGEPSRPGQARTSGEPVALFLAPRSSGAGFHRA